ncbi:hypothetical protein BD779DRAFT_1471995 [Infundibulicybe gibba]|nr:hypothetical protein BD779DRAFT_1471995 [Infundibulicybe gibba]
MSLLDRSFSLHMCQPRCASIGMALSEDPAGSSCTNGNGAALKKCVQCMVALDSSTAVMTQMQGILDHFVANCAGSVSPIRVDAPSSTASYSPSATVPPSAGATSSGSTTGLGTSPSVSSTATGTAGSKGSANQSNSPSAAERATVGSVGLIGLAMGAVVLLL